MRTGAAEKGKRGEELALDYLTGKGYQLKERRYRAPGGEIDFIVEMGDLLVFVEVKYRPRGQAGSGMEAVNQKKQKRILKAAGEYLRYEDRFARPLRFDVVEITSQGILHVENAFMGEWTP